tara:strand:- start:132 stop:410 length:279 start_codon:yes stop_codon:yes gene_type:complete
MVIHVTAHLAVVAIGKFLVEFQELHGKSGVLEVTDTVHVHATDVRTGMVLVVDTIIQKLFRLRQDVTTLYVLLVFTDVVLESVQGVADVTPM